MRVVTPAPRDVWLDVLRSAHGTFLYQTPLGIDAICAEQGWRDASRLYEFSDSRQLVLPMLRTSALPEFLATEVTPAVGSLVAPTQPRPDEIRAIFADLGRRPLLRQVICPSPAETPHWENSVPRAVARVGKTSHLLDLEGGFDAVWKSRFNSQARRACRKAEKAQLEIEHDTGGALVEEFYELYLQSAERWARRRGEPATVARWRTAHRFPLAALQRKAGILGDTCHIWVARTGGRAAAAIIVLFGTEAHYTFGAMDQEIAGPTRASFMLQKLAIEEACARGCRYYNMGETGTSESLARFKEHFGAVALPQLEFRIERLPVTAVQTHMRRLVKSLLAATGARHAAKS